MSENGRTNMPTENEGNIDHEINTILTSMMASATLIPQAEQRISDINNGSSTSPSPFGQEYQMGSNGSSTDNSSFRRLEIGESSRARAQGGNPRPYESSTSMPHIEIGMGMSSTWAPYDLVSSRNLNSNSHQHLWMLQPDHFVLSSSSPFGPQPNQLPPMFRNNQILLSVAWNDAIGNFEFILTSTAPELRRDRNRLRDQILVAQEHLCNSGPGTPEDLMISAYTMALNMLNAQERLDEEEELLEQLEGDAWRYEMEGGLEEEEIMRYIMQEFSPSIPEDEENKKCVICQEDFVDGEHIGRLDCNHTFHLECIKDWLLQKNACPICKQTAIYVPYEDEENDG